MDRVTIKPAKGRRVPMPDGSVLEDKGREVNNDHFVRELLRHEDVVDITPKAVPEAKQDTTQAQLPAPAKSEPTK